MEPVEFSYITREQLGEHYEKVCGVAGLDATDGGWGVLHCIDDYGQKVTMVTEDVPYLKLLVANNGTDALKNLTIPPGKFPLMKPGWPDDWVSNVSTTKTGRNEPCPCGSGKKFKKCHGR